MTFKKYNSYHYIPEFLGFNGQKLFLVPVRAATSILSIYSQEKITWVEGVALRIHVFI